VLRVICSQVCLTVVTVFFCCSNPGSRLCLNLSSQKISFVSSSLLYKHFNWMNYLHIHDLLVFLKISFCCVACITLFEKKSFANALFLYLSTCDLFFHICLFLTDFHLMRWDLVLMISKRVLKILPLKQQGKFHLLVLCLLQIRVAQTETVLESRGI
jgi:hypothetical protein